MNSQKIFAYLAIIAFPSAPVAASATSIDPQIRTVAQASGYVRASSSLKNQKTLRTLVQDDDSVPDEDAVSTDQVDKYIAVTTAMQKNHSLTVEQAASKQGLTVDQFRILEDKIERNPVVHERVLDALKASAHGGKTASSGTNKPQ